MNPNNGIMCGKNKGLFERISDCASDESCTGPIKSDPISRRVPNDQKGFLCSKGVYR